MAKLLFFVLSNEKNYDGTLSEARSKCVFSIQKKNIPMIVYWRRFLITMIWLIYNSLILSISEILEAISWQGKKKQNIDLHSKKRNVLRNTYKNQVSKINLEKLWGEEESFIIFNLFVLNRFELWSKKWSVKLADYQL